MNFPDDDNGDALRRLIADGDNLSQPRDIDFTVVFPNQLSAEGFASDIANRGYKTSVRFAEVEEGLPWDVKVVKHMKPSYDDIAEFEDLLQTIADAWGGQNDGWGCFTHPARH